MYLQPRPCSGPWSLSYRDPPPYIKHLFNYYMCSIKTSLIQIRIKIMKISKQFITQRPLLLLELDHEDWLDEELLQLLPPWLPLACCCQLLLDDEPPRPPPYPGLLNWFDSWRIPWSKLWCRFSNCWRSFLSEAKRAPAPNCPPTKIEKFQLWIYLSIYK